MPLAFALGALLAITVLAKDATRASQRLCAVLAVGPGIVSTLSVAELGRRDAAAQLCAQVGGLHRIAQASSARNIDEAQAVIDLPLVGNDSVGIVGKRCTRG